MASRDDDRDPFGAFGGLPSERRIRAASSDESEDLPPGIGGGPLYTEGDGSMVQGPGEAPLRLVRDTVLTELRRGGALTRLAAFDIAPDDMIADEVVAVLRALPALAELLRACSALAVWEANVGGVAGGSARVGALGGARIPSPGFEGMLLEDGAQGATRLILDIVSARMRAMRVEFRSPKGGE